MTTVRDSLFSLHREHFTGKVTLKKDQVEKTIYFRKGNPTYVDSSLRNETLGQLLLEKKLLNDEQYTLVLTKMKETGRKQGEVIVELGILTGFQVFEALQEQVQRKIQNCFLLEGADLTSFEGEEHLKGIIELSADFFRIYLDSFYSSFMGTLEEKYPANKAIAVTPEGKSYLEARSLSPSESKLLRLLDGKRNLGQIVETAGADPDECGAFLEALTTMKFAQQVPLPAQRYTIPASQVAKEPEPIPSGRKVIEITDDAPTSAEPQATKSPIYLWALRMEKNHFELLNLKPDTNKFSVKRNYDSIVKELHLDSIDDQYKDNRDRVVAEKVLDRLSLAFAVLSDDKRLRDYAKDLNSKDAKPTPAPEVLAEVHAQKGRIHIQKKRWDHADAEFRKAIELAPKEGSYYVEIADLYLHRATSEKTELPSTIEQALRQALKLNSSDERAFFQLGVLAKVHGDTEKAHQYFAKVVQLKPSHAQAAAELRLLDRRADKKGSSPLLNIFKKK